MKRQALPTISCDDKPCGLCCEGMGNLPADYYRCKTEKPLERAVEKGKEVLRGES